MFLSYVQLYTRTRTHVRWKWNAMAETDDRRPHRPQDDRFASQNFSSFCIIALCWDWNHVWFGVLSTFWIKSEVHDTACPFQSVLSVAAIKTDLQNFIIHYLCLSVCALTTTSILLSPRNYNSYVGLSVCTVQCACECMCVLMMALLLHVIPFRCFW